MAIRQYDSGSIRQRNKNSWELRWSIQSKQCSKTFKGTEAEAKRELKKIKSEIVTGNRIRPNCLTVSDALKMFFKQKETMKDVHYTVPLSS